MGETKNGMVIPTRLTVVTADGQSSGDQDAFSVSDISTPAIITTPHHAGEDPCFFRLGLFRNCLNGIGAQHSNIVTSPVGQSSASFTPLASTPLHSGLASSSPATPPLDSASPGDTSSTAVFMHRLSSPNALQRALASPEQKWEDLEDDLLILLHGRLDHLEVFRKLHKVGFVRNPFLLRSLVYLSSRPNKHRDEEIYFEHISAVASHLSVGRTKRDWKHAVLKSLFVCLSPEEAAWQTQDAVIDGTLDFLTQRQTDDWEYMEHSETILIWELRAMCLRLLDREQERLARVVKTGDTAAIIISVGAMLVEEGMGRSVPVISKQIENAGVQVKKSIRADDYPLIMDRDAVVAMAFSESAKNLSEGAKISTKLAINSIRDASKRGLEMAASQFGDGNVSDTLPPEGVEALRAAGKIGMATMGAAVIVGEALLESSRAVLETTAVVTADVVRHKYGTSAGQVASDAGETAVNILRTLGNVAVMSETRNLVTSVAKNTGKGQVNVEAEKAKKALKMLEQQASSFMKDTISYVGGTPAPKYILSEKAPSIFRTGTVGSGEFVSTRRAGLQQRRPSEVGSTVRLSNSVDSKSTATTSSSRLSTTSDEENSNRLSNKPKGSQCSSDTSSVSIASRRSSTSRRSASRRNRVLITPNTAPRWRESARRHSTGGRRRGVHSLRKSTLLTPYPGSFDEASNAEGQRQASMSDAPYPRQLGLNAK